MVKVCPVCELEHSDDVERCPQCGVELRKRTVGDVLVRLFDKTNEGGEKRGPEK